MRAFWSLQLYLDMCKAIHKHHITWSDEQLGWETLEVEKLEDYVVQAGASLDPKGLLNVFSMVASAHAIATVIDYLRDTGWILPPCGRGELSAFGE